MTLQKKGKDNCFWCGGIIRWRTSDKSFEKYHPSCFLQMSDWCWDNVEEALQIMNKSKIKRLDVQ